MSVVAHSYNHKFKWVEPVQTAFELEIHRLIERVATLRRKSPQLEIAVGELKRRRSTTWGNSPYHRKLIQRTKRMVAAHEVAQSLADTVAKLKPGHVKVQWVKSGVFVIEISMLPNKAAGRKLNHGGIIALVPCDDKLYSNADGVSGRLFEAQYAGISEALLPNTVPWPKLIMEAASSILANGGIVSRLDEVGDSTANITSITKH